MADHAEPKEPYKIYLFKVPFSAVNEIILGANICKENEQVIRSFCERKNIKLYKSKISNTKFNMERI